MQLPTFSRQQFCTIARLVNYSSVAMKSNMTILCACAVTFLSLASVAVAVLPNGECSASNQTCELEDNNVIGIINGIDSAEECKQQCLDNNGFCTVFTHFGPAGAPFRETCLLLSSCLGALHI